jgi:hypothetical protein
MPPSAIAPPAPPDPVALELELVALLTPGLSMNRHPTRRIGRDVASARSLVEGMK